MSTRDEGGIRREGNAGEEELSERGGRGKCFIYRFCHLGRAQSIRGLWCISFLALKCVCVLCPLVSPQIVGDQK